MRHQNNLRGGGQNQEPDINDGPLHKSSSNTFISSRQKKSSCVVNINNENNSTWFEGNLLESPPKKLKMSNGKGYGNTPNRGRSFGEEIDGNHPSDRSLLDTSQISIETKDTAISGLTYDDHHSVSGTIISDCITDNSASHSNSNSNNTHVAQLRGWLDEFGKQNKQHFQKIHSAPGPDVLERPVRPKVAKAPTVSLVSVPINGNTSSMIKKQPCSTSKVLSTTSSAIKPFSTSTSTSKHAPTHHLSFKVGQSQPQSAAKVVGKNPNEPCISSIKNRPAVRATPIRLKPKIKSEEVQATNEGYASVAKLSAWLADDPTSTKKVKQIRRGANVIAKSRKFDKELVDVIIEKAAIPRGGVSRQREVLEKCCVTEENEDDVANETGDENVDENWLNDNGVHRTATDWMRLGAPGSDIGISVSDKKKWLSGAFKKPVDDENSNSQLKKAATEIITNRDRNDDLSNRAKQLWRNKYSPVRETTTVVRYNSSAIKPATTRSCIVGHSSTNHMHQSTLRDQVNAILKTTSSETVSTRSSLQSAESGIDVPTISRTSSYSSRENEIEAAPLHQCRSPMRPVHKNVEEDKASVDFRLAREILVQRSKVNGNPVDLSKVQRRKAKFEMLEREARRKSGPTGLLKSSWEHDNQAAKRYVKKYVEDIAPKKSFEDLP